MLSTLSQSLPTPACSQPAQPALQVLGQSTHPTGAYFVALTAAGQLLAGRSAASARIYPSAQQVIDDFLHRAQHGDAGAWNICYCVEDLLAG